MLRQIVQPYGLRSTRLDVYKRQSQYGHRLGAERDVHRGAYVVEDILHRNDPVPVLESVFLVLGIRPERDAFALRLEFGVTEIELRAHRNVLGIDYLDDHFAVCPVQSRDEMCIRDRYTAMWDKTSFSPEVMERELALAEETGLNCARVVLQYAVYAENPKHFIKAFDKFLEICDRHRIKAMPIFFDDCVFGANADPVTGPQPCLLYTS